MKMPTTKSIFSIPPAIFIPFLLLFLAGLILWFLCGRAYLLLESLGNVSAVSHDNEAYIFVNKTTAGINQKFWTVQGHSLFNAWGIGGLAEKLHEDLIVFHIIDDKLEQYCLRDFGWGGFAFPFEGKLYYDRGGDAKDWPYVWQWTGTNFIRVNKSEALRIINQFPPQGSVEHSSEEQFRKEGWQENNLMGFGFKNNPYPIKVKNHTLMLSLIRISNTNELMKLQGRLGNDSEETLLMNDKYYYRWVTKEDYLKAKQPQN